MTNVLPFPLSVPSDKAPLHTRGHIAASFLAQPAAQSHAVQFYDQEEFLYDTVGKFLAAGLEAGDGLVVIATKAHRESFVSRLGSLGVREAIDSGQLMLLDAGDTLSKFMIGDMPDPDLFLDLIARAMTNVREGRPQARVRAYGEMVDVLWRSGNSRAAIRLEELWNDAGVVHSFSLLCAYVMGNFYKEGDGERFMDVCRTHSHVIPTESFAQIEDGAARLREISLLQQRAHALEHEIQNRKELENALRDALRERSRIEQELRVCVQREQEARERAETSDAFKQVFLGILGHDLRNPLNTILTTTRLMTMRRELTPENHKRLARVVSSGERMQRMIEQILDVTRARLAAGIPIKRDEPKDIAMLVSRIVDEIRAAHPERVIDFSAEGLCELRVDSDRFQQVVSNLLGNAVMHGDPEKRISVAVAKRGNVVSVSVHNYGPAIDRELMPLLFDPFKRGGQPQGRSDGLGLGLYISKCVVSAHGGRIDVASSQEAGTCFDVILPQT